MIERTPNPGPPLKPLHADTALNSVRLAQFERLSTEVLIQSLVPGCRDCLKTKADGTIMDGKHRVYVLRLRGVAVDGLPRETVTSEDI